MAKTVLDLVQQILSDMDGDEVNSISETEESEQVARHVIRAFENLVSTRDWLHTRGLVTLTPSGDADFPTQFTIPSNLKRLDYINYDKARSTDSKKLYLPVEWKEPDSFLRYVNRRDNTQPEVQVVVDPSGAEILIRNDQPPSYFTSFDDETIIMDSFDSEVDSTLQQSKVQAQGFLIPTLAMTDNAVIDLPEDALSTLIESATTRAQYKSRQFLDEVSNAEYIRQKRYMARNQWRVNGGIKFPNYGRKV